MSLPEGRQQEIVTLANESLTIIEAIASNASYRVQELKQQSAESSLAHVNTWTDTSVRHLTDIISQNIEDLRFLAREPVIARIVVLTEDEEEKIYYISRTNPAPIPGVEASFASYRAPIGRLASIMPGEATQINIAGQSKYFEVIERTQYHPQYDNDWDSLRNIVDSIESDSLTIESFRRFLLEAKRTKEPIDLLSGLLEEEAGLGIIFEGVRRNVIERMSLRDQPILDKFQDEIFRLPLDTQLLIVGPPGTGKTTTLIRRLGQKLDEEFLSQEEKESFEYVQDRSSLPHKNSWVMFTPTELLKQYVKEAFNREGVPASEERIRTWNDYRHHLARNILSILKSGSGQGVFILNDSKPILKESTLNESVALYEDFSSYFYSQLNFQLNDSMIWLSQNVDNQDIRVLIKNVKGILGDGKNNITANTITYLDALSDDVLHILNVYQEETTSIIKIRLNHLLNKDSMFLESLAMYIESIEKEINIDLEDGESEDEDSVTEELPTRSLPKRQKAYNEYSGAVRVLARAKIAKRKLNQNTKADKIINWLGDRVVLEDDLVSIGNSLSIQTRLRQLANPIRLYIKRVPTLYRLFRRERIKDNCWYLESLMSNSQVNGMEVDIVLLLMLRNINALIKAYSSTGILSNPRLSVLQSVAAEYRNQVLVDEATDFSPIQLACMLELSHPKLLSFFACGDFNQRVTSWGTKDSEQMKWVSPELDIRSISVSYRQSKQLNELATRIAAIDSEDRAVLPKHIMNYGVPPVLAENMGGVDKLSAWLRDRINEIERFVQKLPSIAIFVDTEDIVQPISDSLNEELLESNIRVVSCPEGRIMGQDGDIRVFDVQHIKGLEFEAVFFINVDRLANRVPGLFDKFLYVGITRAATYLGIACEAALPEKMEHVRNLFVNDWSNELYKYDS